jgi:4'-phosphopantetheinyl transferase
MSPAGSPAALVRVFVGRSAALAADPAGLARTLDWMSEAERARFSRFRHDDDRHMFAMGRLMSRTIVARQLGLAPHAWVWREGPHGRPEIASPPTDVRFNLSHSGGTVVCALARGQEVGVDVESLDRRQPDPAIVARYCSAAEAADVLASGDDWFERFLTCWTLKEAYLKARGLGIGVALSDISFDLAGPQPRIGFSDSLAGTDARWAFHMWRPAPRQLAAVAVHTADGLRPTFAIEDFR